MDNELQQENTNVLQDIRLQEEITYPTDVDFGDRFNLDVIKEEVKLNQKREDTSLWETAKLS